MNLISKIEDILNTLLTRIFERMLGFIPLGIRNFFSKIPRFPFWLRDSVIHFFQYFLLKARESHQELMSMNKEKRSSAYRSVKAFFLTPLYMVGHWLDGLSTGQSILLLTFTSASLLSLISIGFSGKRIVDYREEGEVIERVPASVQEDISYERPEYYKVQERHFNVTNLKLPLYEGDLDSLRTVDIDFSATMSNRNSRLFLEKNEFNLRDHLVLTIEPSISDFPLENEGKDIIRSKISKEINSFLLKHEIEGEVQDLKLTYVLAN